MPDVSAWAEFMGYGVWGMKLYAISLGIGLLVGILYSLFGVRSPAPPVVALVGLLGMLIGEQAIPLAKRVLQDQEIACAAKEDCPVTSQSANSGEGKGD
jgi:XapX domain-containing protein